MTIPSAEHIREQASAAAFGRPIIGNAERGLIAEIIVGTALGDDWKRVADDWRGWDFQHRDGWRLEVKQSAARQTWPAPKKQRFSFDIRERTGYYEGAVWIDRVARHAHIYVFAYHPVTDDSADHRDPSQWRFYVVAADTLPASKTIGLSQIKLRSEDLGWAHLRAAVETISDRL